MTETLSALLERVEKAEGPDRELDVAIVMAIYPDIGAPSAHCIGDEPIFWHDPYRKQTPPLLTGSCDAALELVQREFPKWSVISGREMAILSPAGLTDGLTAIYNTYHGEAVARALAICAALLRALSERATERDARAMAGEG